MKLRYLIPTLSASVLAIQSYAAPLASESFSTSGSASDYTSGDNFNTTDNKFVTVGNSGFAGQDWGYGTAFVQPSDAGGLTHDLVVNPTATGYANVIGTLTVNRHSRRAFDFTPSGSTFYVSGLVSMVNGIDDLRATESISMGVASNTTFDGRNYDNGMQLGLSAVGGDVFLSAFADGQTYQLGSALTPTQASGVSMIVLEATLGAAASGDDTLRAWYALDGDTSLTLAGTYESITIASTASDLNYFGIISANTTGGASGSSNDGSALDEFRFGTTLDAVAIPEPSATALLAGLFVLAMGIIRRR